MSTAFAQSEARANIAMLAAIGGKVTQYTNAAGAVSTVGYIDKEGDAFGGDATVSDTRYIVSLLIEDVGAPCRGDRVTDEDGVAWVLREERPGDDPYVTDWVIERNG